MSGMSGGRLPAVSGDSYRPHELLQDGRLLAGPVTVPILPLPP